MTLRHERRRRLFSDDPGVVSGESIQLAGTTAGKRDRPTRAYADAAQAAQRRAVCTLVPSRWLAIALAVGTCLLLVGACLALHIASKGLVSLVPAEDLVALRLDASGSIGHWVASTLLVLAGATAVFVYLLRRHRVDDYHGRYRVWIWMFAACLMASLAETTELGRLARGLCRLAADWSSVRNDVLWPATVGLVATAICVRLWFEIRRCPTAVAALVGTVLCFLFAAAACHDWPVAWTDAGKPLMARGSWLVGYVFLLATFILYARHVQLEVSGALAVPTNRARPRATATKNDDATAESSAAPSKPALRLRTDLDPVQSSADERVIRTGATSRTSDAAAEDSDDASIAGQSKRHLTRAERRRMRRDARMAS